MTSTFRRHPSRTQAGSSLLEPLISIVILSFGLLGLAHFQLNMLSQSSDSKSRLSATTLAEELLAQVRMDSGTVAGNPRKANAGCYTTEPAAGTCNSATALQAYKAWETKAIAAMGSLAGADKSKASVKSQLDLTTNQLKVTLTWCTKGATEPHSYSASTDVRND